MGRRRRTNLHLPKRMYQRRGKFYFDSPLTGKWEPLGDDYMSALVLYGRLASPLWSGRTLSDVFSRYKTEITPLPINGRERTSDSIANEIRTLDRFNRTFGHLHQDVLSQQHLYKYIDNRTDARPEFVHLNRKAPSAARHDVRFLRKVLAKGIKWGAGSVNAVIGLEFDADPSDSRDVTPEEYSAVYRLANERVQLAMELADIIGQRRGDILTIRREDCTDDGILVRQGKSGSFILIEWTPALRAVVDRCLALSPHIPREYLLRNRAGQPYTANGFNSMWQRLMAKYVKQGGRRFKFHHLRKKAATDLAVAATDEDAQRLLGHKDVKVTKKNYIQARAKKPTRARPAR